MQIDVADWLRRCTHPDTGDDELEYLFLDENTRDTLLDATNGRFFEMVHRAKLLKEIKEEYRNKDAVPEWMRPASLEECIAEWDSLANLTSVPTPIPSLNNRLDCGGWPVGGVSTIVGYTGTRKSEIARHSARHAALNSCNVIHVDVELGKAQIIQRTLSQLSGIPPKELRKADLTEIRQHIAKDKNTRIVCPGGGVPFDKLAEIIDDLLANFEPGNPTLLILDSAQRLANGSTHEQPRLQLQEFMHWTEFMAKSRNVAVLLISEQSRTQSGGMPTADQILTSGAESRSLEFVSSVFLGLIPHIDENEEASGCDEESRDLVSIKIAKNRHGSRGYISEDLVFIKPCWRMEVVPKDKTKGLHERVIDVIELGKNQGFTNRNLCQLLKVRNGSLQSILEGLQNDGILYKNEKNKRWFLHVNSNG